MDHEAYMRRALELAAQAAEQGDVPVGCVIVRDGEIVGEGRNRREENGDATAHAELEAIRDACRRLGSWRLHRCTMYVTLEPCPMCAGGIINARIGTVRYGAKDDKAGACGAVQPPSQALSGPHGGGVRPCPAGLFRGPAGKRRIFGGDLILL